MSEDHNNHIQVAGWLPSGGVDDSDRPCALEAVKRLLTELGFDPGMVRKGGVRLTVMDDVQVLEVDIRTGRDTFETVRLPAQHTEVA